MSDFLRRSSNFAVFVLGAGVGGGAIIIPVLIIICEFSPYYAIPLSNTAIFGGAIVRFLMQITDCHPNPQVKYRTLIDFPCISLLLPAALAGTTLGVMANQVCPYGYLVQYLWFL